MRENLSPFLTMREKRSPFLTIRERFSLFLTMQENCSLFLPMWEKFSCLLTMWENFSHIEELGLACATILHPHGWDIAVQLHHSSLHDSLCWRKLWSFFRLEKAYQRFLVPGGTGRSYQVLVHQSHVPVLLRGGNQVIIWSSCHGKLPACLACTSLFQHLAQAKDKCWIGHIR